MPEGNLGRKRSTLYDNPTSCCEDEKDEMIYPHLSLPLDVVEGMGLDLEDKVSITLKGRVTGLEKTKYNKSVEFELDQGEVLKADSGDTIS